MKFRDDIDPANTWLVSDTHFGHENIVPYCLRPEDHDQAMIAEWRAHVPDDATLLHLGDLVYTGNARFKNITAKELTGARKLLIMGNHDQQRFSFYKQCGFSIVRPFAIEYKGIEPTSPRRIDSTTFIVSFNHYPWNKEEEGHQPWTTWRLHGHIHNNGYTRDAYVPFLLHHINLSVEQTHYRPVNLKLLLDAVLLGQYPETTDEQRQEARDRKAERAQ